MGKSLFQLLYRPASWLACVSLLVLLGMLAACGSDSANTTAAPGTAKDASSAASNSTKATVTSAMTVMIKESVVAGKDQYSIDPATITVKKGDTIALQNASDDDQDFDGGDAAKAGVDVIVPGHGSVNVTFNNVGTFAIKSKLGTVLNVIVS